MQTSGGDCSFVAWVILEWVIRKAEFVGVSLETLNRSWSAHFQGGRHSNLRQKLLWEPPPNGFLKLSFDESYFPHIQMGGIGGVIRDFSGKIIKNFVGPVNCVDSNGAEMHALLVGCRELRQLGGFQAIIEGNSFSTIQ